MYDFDKDYLYPLKSTRNLLKKYATADIEAQTPRGKRSWTNFYMIGMYNGEEYKKYYFLDHFIEDVLEFYEDIPIFFHFLDYDGMFLLNNIKGRKDISAKPILAGSLMMAIPMIKRIKDTLQKYEFRNSYSILPFPLAQLCESFDEHPKVSLDKLEERNYWDCVTLYNIIGKYNKWLDGCIGKTTSQTALKNYRFKHQKHRIWNNRRTDNLVYPTYHGGINEVYQFNLNPDKKMYLYDINSMYPSVMKDNPFPVGRMKKTFNHKKEAIGICLATINEKSEFPLIPEKDTKTYFMRGYKKLWITTSEYETMKEKGEYVRYHVGFETSEVDYIFESYVNEFYKRKGKAKEDGDDVSYMLSKLLLNSLYGKFGQKQITREYTMNPTEKYIKTNNFVPMVADGSIVYTEKVSRKNFMIPINASLVCAYARKKLNGYLESVDRDIVFYADTDSAYLSEPKFENSNALGKMALEDTVRPFFPLAPKMYRAGEKYKMKGIPVLKDKKDKDYVHPRELFMALLEGKSITMKRGLEKFRTAIKRETLLNEKTIKKSLKTPYDKRMMNEDLTTNAWNKKTFSKTRNKNIWDNLRKELILQI